MDQLSLITHRATIHNEVTYLAITAIALFALSAAIVVVLDVRKGLLVRNNGFADKISRINFPPSSLGEYMRNDIVKFTRNLGFLESLGKCPHHIHDIPKEIQKLATGA